MDNLEDGSPFTFDIDFHEIVTDKATLSTVTEKFLNNIIDEITLGIIFDMHKKFKTEVFSLDCDNPTEAHPEHMNGDIFGQPNIKRNREGCECPICHAFVSPKLFAPHLGNCMGFKSRSSLRNSAKRTSSTESKDRETPVVPHNHVASDEDEEDDKRDGDDKRDADWNPGKKQDMRRRQRSRPRKR